MIIFTEVSEKIGDRNVKCAVPTDIQSVQLCFLSPVTEAVVDISLGPLSAELLDAMDEEVSFNPTSPPY